MSFDWQTDEDGWEPVIETAVPDKSALKRKWLRGMAAFVGLFVIALAAWFIFSRQAQQQVDTAVAGLETEVAAAHILMQDSALAGDLELFELTLLPSQEWRETQLGLLARQLFWNRSALGLWLDLIRFDPEDETQTSYEFAPDLRTVEVTTILPYLTMGADEELQEVALEKTAVFRNVGNQWQLAPFPAEFWGEAATLAGESNLTVQTHARDEEISRRLAEDLDALIGRACDLPDFDCPDDMKVELRLEIDPESAYRLTQNYRVQTTYRSDVGRVTQIRMPTPTLVGLPVDEAGYQALLRGYGAQILARIIANLDSNCCIYGPNVPSPFAVHLQTLGLHPPRPPEYHPQTELMQTPIPLPEQDIVAMCQEDSASRLFRYDPAAAEWFLEYGGEGGPMGFVLRMDAADGNGVFISTGPSVSVTSAMWQLLWVENGRASEIVQSEERLYLLDVFPYWEEDSQDVVIFYMKSAENNSNEWEEHLIRIDLSTCVNPSGCTFEELPQLPHYPIYSPERTHSLVHMLSSSQNGMMADFWLGDAAGEPVVSLGELNAPVWLDEETILFVDGQVAGGYTSLYRAAVAEEQGLGAPELLLTDEAVNQFLAEQGVDGRFAIGGVVADENGINGSTIPLYVVQLDNPVSSYTGTGYLLEYDLINGRLDWMEPLAQLPLLWHIRYSPNGRYLQVVSFQNGTQHLHLVDVKTGEMQTYPAPNAGYGFDFSWSADGQWLVIAGKESVSLVAPSTNFERKIFYTMTSCGTAVWVNRTE